MSHQSFTRLTGGGFSEEQTEALFEVYGDGYESLATKRDLEPLATKDDLAGFVRKEDLEGFARKEDLVGFATQIDLQSGLQSLELSLTLRFGALMVAGVGVLAALERF